MGVLRDSARLLLMPDAQITLAEMIAEARVWAAAEREKRGKIRKLYGNAYSTPFTDRRIAVMEEIVRYLRREMESE